MRFGSVAAIVMVLVLGAGRDAAGQATVSFEVPLTPNQIPAGIALQALWLTVGLTAFRLIWSRGLRRYSAVGA